MKLKLAANRLAMPAQHNVLLTFIFLDTHCCCWYCRCCCCCCLINASNKCEIPGTTNKMKWNEMRWVKNQKLRSRNSSIFQPLGSIFNIFTYTKLRPQRAKSEMCFTRWRISKNKLIKITRTCRRLLAAPGLIIVIIIVIGPVVIATVLVCTRVCVCLLVCLFVFSNCEFNAD